MNKILFKFLIIFLLCFSGSLFFLRTDFAQLFLKSPTAILQTTIITKCLENIIDISCVGTTLYGSRYSILINNECTPFYSIALFISATIAFPCAISKKIKTIFLISILIFLLSLFRISAIYVTGVYFTKYVDVMHDQIAQNISLILLSLFWLYWINSRDRGKRAEV